jgi:WD40 repeat protein
MGNYFAEEVSIQSSSEEKTLPNYCLQLYQSSMSISNLTLLKDNQTMVASSDCQIKIWDIIRKQYEGSIVSTCGFIHCILPINEKKIICGMQNGFGIWNVYTKELLMEKKTNSSAVLNISFSKNQNTLLASSDDSTLSIYSFPDLELIQKIKVEMIVNQICFLSNVGKFLLSDIVGNMFMMEKDKITIYNEVSHQKSIQCFLSPEDASWFGLVEEQQKSIQLYSIDDGKVFKSFVDSSIILCLSYTEDGLIVSGNKEGIIKFWDIALDECVRSFVGLQDPVRELLVFDNSIVAGTHKGGLLIWKFLSIESKLLNLLKKEKATDLNFKFKIF